MPALAEFAARVVPRATRPQRNAWMLPLRYAQRQHDKVDGILRMQSFDLDFIGVSSDHIQDIKSERQSPATIFQGDDRL